MAATSLTTQLTVLLNMLDLSRVFSITRRLDIYCMKHDVVIYVYVLNTYVSTSTQNASHSKLGIQTAQESINMEYKNSLSPNKMYPSPFHKVIVG